MSHAELDGQRARRRARRFGFVAFCLALVGCHRAYRVGDHVLVDWRGADHPAVIVAVEGPSHLRVHYDGYGEDWDESVTAVRIRGRLSDRLSDLASAERVGRAREPASSASAQVSAVYRAGDRVRVEWHATIYAATIVSVLGGDRYRVHYEGYGNEWDESIGLNRIQRK